MLIQFFNTAKKLIITVNFWWPLSLFQSSEGWPAAPDHPEAGDALDRQTDLQPHTQAQQELQDQRLPRHQGEIIH